MKYINLKNIKINKHIIATLLFSVMCVLLYVKFPSTDYFQFKVKAIIFFVIVPYIYQKVVLKEKSFLNNIKIGDWKNNITITSVCILVGLLLIGLIFRFTDLLNHYPLSLKIRNDFWQFFLYEVLSVSFTVLLYDIFFRGFVISYFAKYFGKVAILIQIALFVFMLLLLSVPFAFYFWYIVFIPLAGIIFYKTNSLIYSFLGHLIFMILTDAIAIKIIA